MQAPPVLARGLGAEQVRDAEEVGHEERRGLLVDHLRRPALLDAAAVHDGDAVAHRERLLLVVRDEDERDAERLLERLELDLQILAQAGVERAERLVEQQHARPQHERAGQRDALLLTARELPGLALLVAGELHERERLADGLRALRLGDLLVLEAERDVVGDVEVREQRVALEHRVDVAAVRRRLRDVLAVEQDAPARRPLEARDHAQRRRLAAARRPDHREELAGRHVEVDAVDGDDVGAERLDELLEPDFALHPLHLQPAATASAPSPPAKRR